MDLPLIGRKFTWSNNQERLAMSRIDKFHISKELEELHVGLIQVALQLADRCAITLIPNEVDWGLKQF